MKFLYFLAFLFGADNWKIDQLPEELKEALDDFDKANSNVLDIGCGDGRQCISLASAGWRIIGVDYVPLAIRKAKLSAKRAQVSDRTTFYTGDVSNLKDINFPPIHFAYDIGCFHLLKPKQVDGYISDLSDLLVKDGLFLLNAFTPRLQGRKTVGFDHRTIEELFKPKFKIERTSNHSYWRFPANWYWLRRL